MLKLLAAGAACLLVFAALLQAQEPARSSGIPGVMWQKTDDPGGFNWDKPDLITWSFTDNAFREEITLADAARVVYRGREWVCRITPTSRKTWAFGAERHFQESRGIECKLPTGQTAAVFATCRYRPFASEFDVDEVEQYIGDSATTEWEHMRWLHLQCSVGSIEVLKQLNMRR